MSEPCKNCEALQKLLAENVAEYDRVRSNCQSLVAYMIQEFATVHALKKRNDALLAYVRALEKLALEYKLCTALVPNHPVEKARAAVLESGVGM